MKAMQTSIILLCLFFCLPEAFAQKQITRQKKAIMENSQQNNANARNDTKGRSSDELIIKRLMSNMVAIEGGSYYMGSNEQDSPKDETPSHLETIKSFHIGKYEVTQKEWQTIMGSNPSYFKGDDLPVENVSWDDCQEFIRKLNERTGKNFRLPTEAEWEYAAKGGNKSKGYKYSGGNELDKVAWHSGNSENKTHRVGLKAANELGLHDMSGNVWEWTSDNWCDNYKTPRNSASKVRRGGSWDFSPVGCRTTYRVQQSIYRRRKNFGLRLAL